MSLDAKKGAAKWDQLKADVKARWAKLTHDDIELLGAKRDKLIGKIAERYGIVKDQAEKEVHDWTRKVNTERKEP
jgi:uncharacterized protein YjbJ (UPF0337 family)